MSKTWGRGVLFGMGGVMALLVGAAVVAPATTAAPIRTDDQGQVLPPTLTATANPDRGDGLGRTIDVTVVNPNAEFSNINCWAFIDDTFPVAGDHNPLITYSDGGDRAFPGQTQHATLARLRSGERVITASCHTGEMRQNKYLEAKATPITVTVGG
ncbi:hypothetical protein ACIA8C_39880 [Nocardia sp. NPDC051321]|uniref:hypothetical protein n=1 Tax=Nocardia sp. NPDC051321 TaxID=3364323 RepID=UPI00378BBD70